MTVPIPTSSPFPEALTAGQRPLRAIDSEIIPTNARGPDVKSHQPRRRTSRRTDRFFNKLPSVGRIGEGLISSFFMPPHLSG